VSRDFPEADTHSRPSLEPPQGSLGPREIIMPHDPNAGPVTAVRNVVIQSSLKNLQVNGHYERYVSLIAPATLAELERLGPGWVPLALASAHYEACENLMLSPQELAALGSKVGENLQETALVSSAKKVRDADFDVWSAVPALHRMWARLNQGGSVQIVRTGPREKLLEMRGFSLNRFHYYRQAQVWVVAAAESALGPRMAVKILSYSKKTHELVLRTNW
jgi:hypothetical protein